MRSPARLEFFSLGGIVGMFWRPAQRLLPWLLSATVLVLLSCWDLFRGIHRIDFVVMGLAWYELAIGLTDQEMPASRDRRA